MIQHLKATDYARTPWKNGLGWTEQIAIHPKHADLRKGDFEWRISTAHIAQSAPFSVFENHDRLLVILECEGSSKNSAQAPVILRHTYEPGDPPEVVELPLLEPYEFPGDIQTSCELKAGAVQDLSVFFQKGRAQAQATVQHLSSDDTPLSWEPQAKTCFVFVVSGTIIANQHTTLNARESLRIDGDSHTPFTIELVAQGQPACVVLLEIFSD